MMQNFDSQFTYIGKKRPDSSVKKLTTPTIQQKITNKPLILMVFLKNH